MFGFIRLVDAQQWLQFRADGPCTVIVHGDPYEWIYSELRWIMVRRYPNDFYMKSA